MNLSRSLLIITFCLFNMTGCNSKDQRDYQPQYSDKSPISSKKIYIFGVHPLHNPKKLFKVYGPLVDYINKNLQTKNIKLKLEASRNYPSYDKKLFGRKFHFSLPNPYQTVKSTEHGYNIFGKMSDDHNFRGIIIIRKDSKIEKVSDLKGKNISYPAPTALAATMMPQWYLHNHGLDIMKDVKNFYVGSQESSMMNVYLKKTQAGATWPPPWKSFSKDRPEIAKHLMVKWTTKPLPNNGLVARDDVPEVLVREISEIIFSLHYHKEGKRILKAMELSKFEKANDSTYKSVRKFLKKFEEKIRPIRGES